MHWEGYVWRVANVTATFERGVTRGIVDYENFDVVVPRKSRGNTAHYVRECLLGMVGDDKYEDARLNQRLPGRPVAEQSGSSPQFPLIIHRISSPHAPFSDSLFLRGNPAAYRVQ